MFLAKCIVQLLLALYILIIEILLYIATNNTNFT